ncbi:hypothetical protein AJ80_04443 [Polytolypa hystricis UAMH7299]|uniref:C3H1-type domain-containing protein n=1 Tax=Polytolypa hystricis (strain UAMH7299) TaxID=1447883 RepID=A0A2B7YBR5_POLH7|nr:hypothetical protein AJ80_04443 [Polytolypa hystricis UAMH7299]
MSSGGFSFPPPPPPPPSAQSTTARPGTAAGQPPFTQNYRGRGSGGHHRGGRGRGNAYRGNRGGHLGGVGHGNAHHMNYAAPGGTYGAQPHSGANQPSNYNNAQGPPLHYPPPQDRSKFPQNAPFTQQSTPHSLPPHTTYNPSAPTPYQPHHPAPSPGGPGGYAPPVNLPHHVPSPTPHRQAPVMGPPMRWGFDQRSQGGSYSSGSPPPNFAYPDMRDSQPAHLPHQAHERRGTRPMHGHTPNQHSGGEKFGHRGNKRPHSSAFNAPQNAAPRPSAPLPVPSFGNPLPSKPPPAVDATRKPKKKRRKYNQLGLTPKTEEHESSEEEEEVDEEAKLAQNVPTDQLKITYRGQTSVLQSSTDIAAWIEERRKRFPTRARVEEKLKEAEERKQAVKEARKAKASAAALHREKEQEEVKRRLNDAKAKKEQEKLDRKALRQSTMDPADAAAKAKLKAEKLRRKLMKEEKRVAKAEAEAEKARLRVEGLKAQTAGETATDSNARPDLQDGSALQESGPTLQGLSSAAQVSAEGDDRASSIAGAEGRHQASGPLNGYEEASTSKVPALSGPEPTGPAAEATNGNGTGDMVTEANNVDLSAIDGDDSLLISSDSADDSDGTSSSGSDVSSDDSDSDCAPEEATSRRERPERVAPPPRQDGRAKANICRAYAKNGRCWRGDKCKFLHEAPSAAKGMAKPGSKRAEKDQRKTLLQKLIGQEKDDGDRHVMQAISWLGKHGVLDEPVVETTGGDVTTTGNGDQAS